jgi:hypothetical protein
MATRGVSAWADNPYGKALGDADVMVALGETPGRLREIVDRLTPAQMASSYAAGKWTAAQLLVHLAQCECVFGDRVRMALAQDAYTVQPFDQDVWLHREAQTDGWVAFRAYGAMRQMNLSLYRSLTDDERAKVFHHPERGAMHVEWILEMLAGHERHHLVHFQIIAG